MWIVKRRVLPLFVLVVVVLASLAGAGDEASLAGGAPSPGGDLALGVGGSALPGSATAGDEGAELVEETPEQYSQRLDNAIHTRETLGFRADKHYVDGLQRQTRRMLRKDGEVGPLPEKVKGAADIEIVAGFAYTKEEAADLEARADAAAFAQTVEAYGADHEDEYGGLYLDQKRGGSVIAQFTNDVAGHRKAIFAAVSTHELLGKRNLRSRVKVDKVAHTSSELKRIALDALEAVKAAGLGGNASGAKIDENSVVVGVSEDDVAAAAEVVEAKNYRVPVGVEASPPVELAAPIPGGTGIKVIHQAGPHYSNCVAGFGVFNWSGYKGILTAGHCTWRWGYGYGYLWETMFESINDGYYQVLSSYFFFDWGVGTVDSALFSVPQPGRVTNQAGYVLVWGSRDRPAWGELLCFYGRISPPDCGEVVFIDEGYGIYKLDRYAAEGDSGAPVYTHNGLAAGLVHAVEQDWWRGDRWWGNMLFVPIGLQRHMHYVCVYGSSWCEY